MGALYHRRRPDAKSMTKDTVAPNCSVGKYGCNLRKVPMNKRSNRSLRFAAPEVVMLLVVFAVLLVWIDVGSVFV
jgi:hypothetical protein